MMQVFHLHCPSYNYFRGVMEDLRKKSLLKKLEAATGDLTYPYNDDLNSPSLIPTDILSSILLLLRSDLQQEVRLELSNRIYSENNDDYTRAASLFNFLILQDMDNKNTKQEQSSSHPLCLYFPFKQSIYGDAIMIEISYKVVNDDMIALTRLSYNVTFYLIPSESSNYCFTYQLLKSIICDKSIEGGRSIKDKSNELRNPFSTPVETIESSNPTSTCYIKTVNMSNENTVDITEETCDFPDAIHFIYEKKTNTHSWSSIEKVDPVMSTIKQETIPVAQVFSCPNNTPKDSFEGRGRIPLSSILRKGRVVSGEQHVNASSPTKTIRTNVKDQKTGISYSINNKYI